MTLAERHTRAARLAVQRRDVAGFIRALIGWLGVVAQPEETTPNT